MAFPKSIVNGAALPAHRKMALVALGAAFCLFAAADGTNAATVTGAYCKMRFDVRATEVIIPDHSSLDNIPLGDITTTHERSLPPQLAAHDGRHRTQQPLAIACSGHPAQRQIMSACAPQSQHEAPHRAPPVVPRARARASRAADHQAAVCSECHDRPAQ